MANTRWLMLILIAGLMISSSGCLFNYSREHVLRESEPRQAVRFESPEAQHAFESRALSDSERKTTESSGGLSIPFLLSVQNKRILSQNAFYNDQLSLCDSDGDGMVAVAEAQAFNPSVVTWPQYPTPQPASVAGATVRQPAPVPLSAEAASRRSAIAQPTSMQFARPEIRFAQ